MKFRYKLPKADLRNSYILFLQIGIIFTLILFLGAFKVRMPSFDQKTPLIDKQEVVSIKEVIQTRHKKLPPPPPRPQIPTEVPNDEVIEEEMINIDSEIDFNQRLQLPPPPKKEEKKDQEEVFVVVEQMPKLIGGLKKLQRNIRYPEMARKAGIEGRVFVQFIVNEKGEVENPRVLRGIGGGCDEEAIRAVMKAKFKPGMQRGHPVRVQYSVPIVFRLQN